MVQEAFTYIEQITDSDIKLKLIDTLRTVTAGKVSLYYIISMLDVQFYVKRFFILCKRCMYCCLTKILHILPASEHWRKLQIIPEKDHHPPHSLSQRLRFSEFFSDIVRFIN